jgi:hypothetical protein
VTGSYADSNLKLYSKELSIGSVAGLLILAGIVFFSRKAYKNLKKSKPVQSSVEAPQVQSHHLTNTILLTGALSFISAILMSGYLLFVYLLISALGYYGNQSVFVLVILFIITLIVFALIICGPAIFMGVKRGIWWGIGTFMSSLAWLFIFLCFAVLISLVSSRSYYPTPVPYINQQVEPSYNAE